MNKYRFSRVGAHISGFTLIELMVTVAVVAVLMAIGAPQLRAFMLKQGVQADVNSLATAIKLARSEAMKRSGAVSICPMPAGATAPGCDTKANESSWQHGWMVFIDYPNSAGALGTFEKGDTPLLSEQSPHSKSITTSKIVDNISFLSLGTPTGVMTTFKIGESGHPCKQVQFAITGRALITEC